LESCFFLQLSHWPPQAQARCTRSIRAGLMAKGVEDFAAVSGAATA
jgi:hypothetical protein